MSEAKCPDCDGEDCEITVVIIESQVKNSHLIPNDIVADEIAVEQDVHESGAADENAISQEYQGEHDTAKLGGDESEAEDGNFTSLDREPLNNATAGLHEPPTGDFSLEIAPGMESDNQSENADLQITETASVEVDLEGEAIISNTTAQPGNVCIEMDDIAERESIHVENSREKSLSETTTCLYFSEGDSTDLESDVCRICHCSDEAEVLISPCLCTGSVKFVHHSCLMSWLQRVVMSKCELCLYPLAVKRKRKPLSKWRLPEDKPFPILWLFTFIVAMTLNIASIAKDGSQRCVSNPCIIFYVLGSAGALLGLAFFYHWLRKTMRYLAKWIALNQEWSLVGPIDLRSQLGQTNLAYSTKSLSETDNTQEQIA